MNAPLTVECRVDLHHMARGRKKLAEAKSPTGPSLPPGRVPNVSRWLALALHMEQMRQEGEIRSYAELAELGRVTPGRISQITNLLYLTPDIQEAVLFLPRTQRGRDPIILRDLQPIAAVLDWREQRRRWRRLIASTSLQNKR